MDTDDRLGGDDRALLLLRAAREAGVLDALVTEAGTPAAVADAADVTERAAGVVVAALHDRGFLERVGDAYEPTNRLLGFLARTDVRSIGRLPHALDCLDAWLALPETMAGADPPTPDARAELGARWAVDDATVRATVTAAVRAAPDAERVVVLGDAPGRHAREFAERGYDATLFDRPDAVEAARPVVAGAGVDCVAGDPHETVPDADLVLAPGVPRRHDAGANRAWIRAAAAAVGDDGVLVAVDALRERSAGAALLRAHLLATGGGDVYAEAEFREWYGAAGLTAELRAVPDTDLWAVVGASE